MCGGAGFLAGWRGKASDKPGLNLSSAELFQFGTEGEPSGSLSAAWEKAGGLKLAPWAHCYFVPSQVCAHFYVVFLPSS
jgi:hypothetical protein